MHFEELSPDRARSLAPLTFPAYRHLLEMKPAPRRPGGDRRMVHPVGFVAVEGGEPVGLALGCVPAADAEPASELKNDPELLSVFVAPAARARGVAGGLIGNVEEAVRGRGFGEIRTVYMTGGPGIAYLERALARRRWAPPETRMLVVRTGMEDALSLPWRELKVRGFEYFPWTEMTEEDVRELKASHQRTGWIADDLRPWHYDRATMEPTSSIGIRYRGEVVGWVLNHPLSGDTLRFTCSFIRGDLARRARILPAYMESLRRARDAGFTRLMFTVPMHHPGMAAFAMRWSAIPGAEQVETRGSVKVLADAAAL